jgi:hypothetical protein
MLWKSAVSCQSNNSRHGIKLTVALLVALGFVEEAFGADLLPASDAAINIPNMSPIAGYFATWQDRVHAAQEAQPHWMTPVVTVTPLLVQEFRYDQGIEHLGSGADIVSSFGGKGLELIPTTQNEVLINVPPYWQRTRVKPAQGFNDWPFLTVKQRITSANEANGNYALTAFLGFQAPTGIAAFTNHAFMITPTLAGGKGWGDFDIQGTIGVPIPTSHQSDIGIAINSNLSFQYHIAQYFWPQLELNDTAWTSGQRSGKNQLFLTPGIVFGRFIIAGDIKAIFGVGYQFAVVPQPTILAPALTPTYNHQWIVTARVTF